MSSASITPRRSKRELEQTSYTDARRSTSSSLSPPPDVKPPPTKRARKTPVKKVIEAATKTTPGKSPKKPSTFGVSPFPDFPRPTPEECQQVTDALEAMHGKKSRPVAVGEPTGRTGEACGAVPSVTDATIRTILSQNTTNQNSAAAYKSLLATFGPSSKNGTAVCLTKVHDAPHSAVSAAIKTGGLNDRKAKYIQGVLSSVRDRNLRFLSDPSFYAKPSPSSTAVKKEEGVEEEDVKPVVSKGKQAAAVKPEPKDLDFTTLSTEEEEALYSLDYIHGMSDEDATAELVSFDGVGPKTASCVLLFCLGRESFAVDTHVFRLSKALGWVPAKANRNTTFDHLDVRIPQHLKYPLHVLLIAHGKSCPRCSAATPREATLGACPLVGLSKPAPKKRSAVKQESDEEEEEVEAEESVKGEDDDEFKEVGAEGMSKEMREAQSEAIDEAVRIAHGG